MGKVCYEQCCYRFKFLEGIRIHWLFHAGLGEIRFLKGRDVINSNSWFFAILNRFSEGLPLLKLIFFFLKIKKDFKKMDVSNLLQSARPTHPLALKCCKLWEDSVWLTSKTNKPSFCVIPKLCRALDRLFRGLLSGLHGCKRKCSFWWMKHHWMGLLSDIVA